jgi:Tetratricopeptide repeat
MTGRPEGNGPSYIDLVPDELSLARAQLATGLPTMAEGILRRHAARLEASGSSGALDELDATRSMLAEALWRQGRPLAAGAVADQIRPASLERRRPIVMLIEAEALAASGDTERATALMERVVSAIGVDEAWRLRAGVASRLPWPLPASLRATPRRPAGITPGAGLTAETSPERTAAAHARLEAARGAYGAGRVAEGDRELGLALRLDPRIAPDGVSLLEPTLTPGEHGDRLVLYGDLLRAAGRVAEASDVYDRAARA